MTIRDKQFPPGTVLQKWGSDGPIYMILYREKNRRYFTAMCIHVGDATKWRYVRVGSLDRWFRPENHVILGGGVT